MREIYIPSEQLPTNCHPEPRINVWGRFSSGSPEKMLNRGSPDLIGVQHDVKIVRGFELTLKPNTGYSEERGIFMPEPVDGQESAVSTIEENKVSEEKDNQKLAKVLTSSSRTVKNKEKAKESDKKSEEKKFDPKTSDIIQQLEERGDRIVDEAFQRDYKEILDLMRVKPLDTWEREDFQKTLRKLILKSYKSSSDEALRIHAQTLLSQLVRDKGIRNQDILQLEDNSHKRNPTASEKGFVASETSFVGDKQINNYVTHASRFSDSLGKLDPADISESGVKKAREQWVKVLEKKGISIEALPENEQELINEIIRKGIRPGMGSAMGGALPPTKADEVVVDATNLTLRSQQEFVAREIRTGNVGPEFLSEQSQAVLANQAADKYGPGADVQVQNFVSQLNSLREDAKRIDTDEATERQVQAALVQARALAELQAESRNKMNVVERVGWNYTPNEEALAQAAADNLFVPQVAAIRAMWRAIEAAERIPDEEARKEAMKRAFKHDDVKRLRSDLDDAVVPDEHSDRFYDIQGLLSYEFNRMRNRVEGNRFLEHEAHPEEIEFVRRIYRELDDIPEDVEDVVQRARNEEQRDKLFTQLETMLKREVDFASGRLTQQSRILDVIAEESLAKNREGRAHYGLALEFAIEQIIGRGDDNATADYPQFGFYEGNNLEEMIQGARRLDQGFAMYLTNLKGKRAMSHELFKNMKDRQSFVGIVAKGLDPGSMRFIEKEVGGISEVQMLFEKEYARMAAMNSYEGKGWILHDQFKNEVDINMEKWVNSGDFDLRKQVRRWRLDRTRGEYVSENVQGVTRKMRPWEIRRAKNMGRAVSAVALRRQYYGVIGDTPDRISERVETVEGGEEIMMLASPIKLINERYFVFQEGSKMFLNTWCDRKVVEASGNGKRYSVTRDRRNPADKDTFGIFGTTERSNILMDSGTVDVKSSMWRADKMFFDQADYANVSYDDRNITIGSYLFEVKRDIKNALKKDDAWKNKSDHDIDHHVQHLYEHEIRHVLGKQRLFLGLLLTEGDKKIDQVSKKILWENAAQLIPSRIAMLMPQFSMDEVKAVVGKRNDETDTQYEVRVKTAWNDIIRKLAVVEYDRVQEDGRGLKVNKDEHGNLVMVDPSVAERDLMYYIREYNDRMTEDKKISPQQLQVIQRWQELGVEMSGQLAQMVWPMAPFLDDVPKTDWENTGRDELKRLLVNDHNDWGEAYKGITGLIANPATAHPEKAMEAVKDVFHAFVENAKSPTSLSEAQDRVDAFVYTWGKMAQKFPRSAWTYDIAGVFRHPTSMMEKFNLSCGISYDEEEMAKYLSSLANAEIISDDPMHAGKNSLTQYWRLTHELDADRKAKLLMYIRMLMLIFPLEVIELMFKGIAPEELFGGKH